jgi:cytochrome c oxidase subunit 2
MSQNLFFIIIAFSVPEFLQRGFQDPATNMMEGLINFHHDIMTVLVFIAIFVLWFLVRIVWHFKDGEIRKRNLNHNTFLEIVWTVVPALILMVIGIPSFSMLYAMDELRGPGLTYKVMGHQWYWFYDLFINHKLKELNVGAPSFISGTLQAESHLRSYHMRGNYVTNISARQGVPYTHPSGLDLEQDFRLLGATGQIALPCRLNIRVLVTSADVLHSWAVPALGIKMDACPGRLNSLWTNIKRSGTFFGQCSEICGVNHAFMPIYVRALNYNTYSAFIGRVLDQSHTGKTMPTGKPVGREHYHRYMGGL